MQGNLVRRVRDALIPVLTCGSWNQIEADHKKIGLGWRGDLQPGWGKPKYVEQVLDDLQSEEVLAIARRALEQFPERCVFDLEDALLWFDANGVPLVSEVTRLELAKALDGHRLHPAEPPCDVLARFARASVSKKFQYAEDGNICVVEVDFSAFLAHGMSRSLTLVKSNHLALLDAYSFRECADARLFKLIEHLVHPTVR